MHVSWFSMCKSVADKAAIPFHLIDMAGDCPQDRSNCWFDLTSGLI
jgi:hypothetical protein